jgi:hypothetical protein
MSREDRPQGMPDKLDVVHQQDPDDLFASHTDLSSLCTAIMPLHASAQAYGLDIGFDVMA